LSPRRKQTPEERVAEYVDSRRMTQRVRYKKQLSARISGNYDNYRTRVKLTKKVSGDCTCPSELWSCKHVKALRKTWDVNPDSFFDVDQFLTELTEWTKASLIKVIGQTVMEWPKCLCMFGVPDFDEEEEDDEDDDWEEDDWEDE
jgi:hypothetical protein